MFNKEHRNTVNKTRLLFLDLAKAFDSVDHETLFKSLRDCSIKRNEIENNISQLLNLELACLKIM